MAFIRALRTCAGSFHSPDHSLADRAALADMALSNGGVFQRTRAAVTDGAAL